MRRCIFIALITLAAPACRRRDAAAGQGTRGAQNEAMVPGQVPAPPSVYAGGATAPGVPGVVQSIPVGAVVSGTLQPGDTPQPTGGVMDNYVLNLTAGLPVTIVARGGPSTSSPGTSLDMYIYLFLNGVEVMHDDDSASNGSALNSRIVFMPTASGAYTLRVTTFGGGTSYGAYTLQTYPGSLYSQM